MDRNAYQMLIAFNRETKKLDDVYRSAAKSCGISECAFWILYTLRVEEKPFTQAEIGVFTSCVELLQQHFRLRFRHLAASAGELGYEVPCANLIRPGLILYGYSPIASIYDGVLRSTLKLASRVTLVRELPAGHGVAYGRTFSRSASRLSASAMRTGGLVGFPVNPPLSISMGGIAPCSAA